MIVSLFGEERSSVVEVVDQRLESLFGATARQGACQHQLQHPLPLQEEVGLEPFM
jgi:hypothetical protein